MALKLFVQYEPNESGKGKFLTRLIPALSKYGVECRFSPDGCDATIAFSKFRVETPKKMPKILRVDGVHMANGKAQKWRNKQASKCVAEADMVIWQAEFCKRVAGGILDAHPKHEAIIWNGAPFVQHEIVGGARPLMAAKWWDLRHEPRIHKRLDFHAEVASLYWKETGITTDIAGETYGHVPFSGQGVNYLGNLDDEALGLVMRRALMFVYLPWYDWCPNVVVEATANDCLVVCSNQGGHAEFVEGHGIVLGTDHRIKPRMLLDYKVPHPDPRPVVDAMVRGMQYKARPWRNPEVDIERVAHKYATALEGLLCTG